MKKYTKTDFPVYDIRRFLEPGPVVLVSSAHNNEHDIMTMGWHMVMEFTPSLIGCVTASSHHSFELIRKSKQCVINIPTADMASKVEGIGNCSGSDVDKFKKFGLTAVASSHVNAPSIKECFANLECELSDAKLINAYNLFIFRVIKAHVATRPRFPALLHYHGRGIFSTQGKILNLSKQFSRKFYF